MEFNELGKFKDELLNVDYTLEVCKSASKLSNYLKEQYQKLGINFKEFNTESNTEEEKTVLNPPPEIYEYQNFVILELKESKNFILLDGFRRLLWYNSPDKPIIIRRYKQNEMTNKQLLQLLVYLNHFKFFKSFNDDISYQDRGFGLFLYSIFKINIAKIRNTFNGYLMYNNTKHDYLFVTGKPLKKNQNIKERILNEHFVDDVKFIQQMSDNNMMINNFVGSLIYQRRMNLKEPLNFQKFYELCINDRIFVELNEKYKKVGNNNSAQSHKIVNGILKIYNKYFDILEGKKVEKTYEEKVAECKDLRKEINKDKNYVKLTGSKNDYIIERLIRKAVENKNYELKFKCIVFPQERKTEELLIDYGLNLNVQFKELNEKKEIVLMLKEKNNIWTVSHNYGGYWGYGKKYTHIKKEYKEGECCRSIDNSRDVEIWVNFPKAKIKELAK